MKTTCIISILALATVATASLSNDIWNYRECDYPEDFDCKDKGLIDPEDPGYTDIDYSNGEYKGPAFYKKREVSSQFTTDQIRIDAPATVHPKGINENMIRLLGNGNKVGNAGKNNRNKRQIGRELKKEFH